MLFPNWAYVFQDDLVQRCECWKLGAQIYTMKLVLPKLALHRKTSSLIQKLGAHFLLAIMAERSSLPAGGHHGGKELDDLVVGIEIGGGVLPLGQVLASDSMAASPCAEEGGPTEGS